MLPLTRLNGRSHTNITEGTLSICRELRYVERGRSRFFGERHAGRRQCVGRSVEAGDHGRSQKGLYGPLRVLPFDGFPDITGLSRMDRLELTLARVGRLTGYGLVGLLGSAAVSLLVLNLIQPVQPLIYDLFYLRLGPTGATETAILAHFLLSGVVALGTVMVAGDLLSDRGGNLRALGVAFAGMVGIVGAFLVTALTGLVAFLGALGALGVLFVGVPLALRFRFRVRSGALPAFMGAIPVILLLLFLAGFGIGWGWGYVVTAEEVPPSAVDGASLDFDEAPEFRDDLLVRGDCETTTDDVRQCRLQLRGYSHERSAIKIMARHGVRCPYQNTHSGETDAFVGEYDGTYYRVTCSPHGD